MLVELFPTKDRLSGYSVAYDLGLGVVGSSTPMICTWLISFTGTQNALAGFSLGIAVNGAVIHRAVAEAFGLAYNDTTT